MTPPRLTERQMEVLRAFSEELSFADVAGRLFMSIHTMSSHAADIREALHVNSMCEAVIKGLREGWLE